MRRLEATISVSTSEKMSPAAYESLDRTVILSERIEFGEEDAGREEEVIASETAWLQMRAEAQMYAALSRGMGSRGQKTAFLRSAAIDRASRTPSAATGSAISIDPQCDSESRDATGVIS